MSSKKDVSDRRRRGSSASGRRRDSVQPERPGAEPRGARSRRKARTAAEEKAGEGASRGQAERGFGRGEVKAMKLR